MAQCHSQRLLLFLSERRGNGKGFDTVRCSVMMCGNAFAMKIPAPGLLVILSAFAHAGSPPDVRIKGEAGMDLRSSAGAPWQWRADEYAAGKQTLAAGAPADEGGPSWLELNVRGPDRLYFKSRIKTVLLSFDWSGITMSDVFPRNVSFLTSDI